MIVRVFNKTVELENSATKIFLLVGLLAAILPALTWACDPCALYNASRLRGHSEGSWTLGMSEQYTEFDEVPNQENPDAEGELTKTFSTTQFLLAYDISSEIGLSLSLPMIYRRFEDITHSGSSTDSETGIGDIALMGDYSIACYQNQDWNVLLSFGAGVKFPTGDTGALEPLDEAEDEHAEELSFISRHHDISSTSGSRILSLGTGSYDYITSLGFLSRYKRFLFLTNAQYIFRTEGDFDYRFADDLVWSTGPGAYFVLDDRYSLAGRAVLSGEYKDADKRDDELVEGSRISNIYVGPEIIFTYGDFSGELGLDMRVSEEDSGARIRPDFKLRTSLAYRF